MTLLILFSKRFTLSVWEIILLLQSEINIIFMAIWAKFTVLLAIRMAILSERAVTAAKEKGNVAFAVASLNFSAIS